jgi:hypothetical protein
MSKKQITQKKNRRRNHAKIKHPKTNIYIRDEEKRDKKALQITLVSVQNNLLTH